MVLSFQVNTVFDRLRETQNYTGYVIFLEEDHFVAPDFLEVAKQLIGMRKTQCTECDFINLGMYNKVRNYAGVAHRVSCKGRREEWRERESRTEQRIGMSGT